jgi:hypothetical protein
MTQADLLPKEVRSADFSECRRYRYTLKIVWDDALPLCQVIGLNPSTADEFKDDPTLRRVKGFAKAWGHGGIVMTNLFAWRDTKPAAMKKAALPIGECSFCSYEVRTANRVHSFTQRNDAELFLAAQQCALTIAAWGNHGTFLKRDQRVRDLIKGMKCFRLTNAGQPEHPLYMPAATQLIDFV